MDSDSSASTSPRLGGLTALLGAAFLVWIAATYAAFLYAPTERIEGDIQRLFYIHVPAALTMYVAYGIVTLGSVMYLWRRQTRWDEVASSAAEVGALFATIVVLTGPMWAKPVWGTWWVWDARLTSMFVLWLIFMAYVMLRAYGGNEQQVARYSAVLALIGFVDLPIIHYSVEWWRTLHPGPKIMTEGSIGQGLEGSMLATFAVGFLATLLLFAALLLLRLQIERARRQVDALARIRHQGAVA